MSAGNTGGSAPYLTADDNRVLIKNNLLTVLLTGFLLLVCIRHYTHLGLLGNVLSACGMYLLCCRLFPKEQKPLYSLKRKAGHYLFFTVTGLSCTFLFAHARQYAESFLEIRRDLLTLPVFLKVTGMIICMIFAVKIDNRYLKRLLQYAGAGLVIWSGAALLRQNRAMTAFAVLLSMLFFFADIAVAEEGFAVTEGKLPVHTSGVWELMLCALPALFAFQPVSDAWSSNPAEKFGNLLGTVLFLYLLLTCIGTAIVCASYYQRETFSNNESAFFVTGAFVLLLLLLNRYLPFDFSLLIPAAYLLLSVPFMLSVGDQSRLAKYAQSTHLPPWALHLILSGVALGAHLLLSGGFRICTVALVFAPYLVLSGGSLSALHRSHFRWHVYPVIVFCAFAALCVDAGVFRLSVTGADLLVMLILQGVQAVWNRHEIEENSALSLCSGKTAELLGNQAGQKRREVLGRIFRLLISAVYALVNVLLVRKLMLY